MKYTYRFSVEAPVEAVDEILSHRWLSFVPFYRGLESADPNWPEEGSSIMVRFGLGSWTVRNNVTVVEHERGRRFRTHEEVWSGVYIDKVDVTFEAENGVTRVTLIRNLTSKFAPIRLLILLLAPISRWLVPLLVIRRIKAMIASSEAVQGTNDGGRTP